MPPTLSLEPVTPLSSADHNVGIFAGRWHYDGDKLHEFDVLESWKLEGELSGSRRGCLGGGPAAPHATMPRNATTFFRGSPRYGRILQAGNCGASFPHGYHYMCCFIVEAARRQLCGVVHSSR